MSDRVLIWHIPRAGEPLPVYYAAKDYEPIALRIYAERAPDNGDLKVDILATKLPNDGVSIMNANTLQTMKYTFQRAYIEFGTPSATDFSLNETITGGTSGASARVYSKTSSRLTLDNPSATAFTVAETITGGTSTATGVVNAYVKEIHNYTPGTKSGQSNAGLRKGATSETVAQDFNPHVVISEGSWISLSILDLAGAGNVTIQLELSALGESQEDRIRVEGR